MNDKGRIRFAEDWYRFAAEDLAAAKELHHERDYFFHQTCLLCQQSVEKYLKAFLLSQGWKLAKTHELSRLVGIPESDHRLIQNVQRKHFWICSELNPFKERAVWKRNCQE